jgi:signal transduction histidine kinase
MTDRVNKLGNRLRRPLRRMGDWPLQVQLAGAFACAILLCIGLHQIAGARATLREELADSHEKQQLLAEKAALALDRHLDRVIADFLFLAGNADRLGDLHDLTAHMAGFGLLAVQVIGPDGAVATTQPPGRAGLPPLPEAADLAALTAGPAGVARLSGIEFRDGQGFVRIGTRGEDGLAVTGVISVDFAHDIQQRVRFGAMGHAAIVDAGGRVIAHPDPQYEADRRDLSGLSVVSAALGGETGAGLFFSPALQAEALAGYAPVPSTGWAVIVPRPVAELEAQAGAQLAEQSLIGALALGVGLVASALLARAVTRPIGRLTQAATRMAAGDYRQPLAPVDRQGGSTEIAVLGTAFDRMRGEIEGARESLLTALERAQRESDVKSRVLTTIGHELRTPMNAVLGMLRVAAEEQGGTPAQDPLARAEAAAQQLHRMIDDILEFNGNTGGIAVRPRAFAPRELLAELVAAVSREADAKGVALRVATDPAMPDIVQADPDRLRRVLLAITCNAVKFTDHGTVEIGAALREDGAAGPLLEFRVADTGIGIPEPEMARIFEGFQQADSGYARRRGGLGLGLAIARRILLAMGGSVTGNSLPGEGSVFIVTVPVVPMPDTAPRPRSGFDLADARE